MELMELYNQIQNPLDDPKVIEKLIEVFANSSKGLGGFYGNLIKTVHKEHNKGQYFRVDGDKFYADTFNKWKNSIVSITRDRFHELYKNGSYGKDFIKMREYLKNVPDVSTKEEADDIFFRDKGDKELEDALLKYRWSAFGGGSGWTHVCSRHITAKKDPYINVEHRLYVDTESFDTFKMINFFIEKCEKYNLPYYFKFDSFANRDDTIAIYSSTEYLTKYLDILQEIKREHPDLVSRVKEPPLLTGKIDNWIGYGSEPSIPDGKKHSFNEIRTSVIEPAIAAVTNKWIMDHKDMQITYQGQRLSFKDYVAMKSTENLIAELERKFINFEGYEKSGPQNSGKSYDQSTIINRYGYSLQDIRSPQFKQNLFKALSNHMESSLAKVCSGNADDMKSIVMNVRNGKQITFGRSDLEETIKQLAGNISKNDPNFISLIRAQINSNAKQYGIDTDKFCFDNKARETMKTMSEQIKVQQNQIDNQNQEEISNESLLQEKVETYKEKEKIDMSSLNIQTILNILEPTLMEKMMKLPNGTEIPARQYIQNIVYPQLPKNGFIILSNGSVLPLKQFIEEGIMYECQEKYNGDFPKYMADRTRNNVGVISIGKNEEKFEISPIDITEFINPTLLKKRVKLPNGVDISAKQYIQEFFSPHIPVNGRVTLASGAEISVIQYIEEVLLVEGQEKYNGDINQILFNTTRNNLGTINADSKKIQEALIEIKNQADFIKQGNSIENGPKR